jgi:hypothetical protein
MANMANNAKLLRDEANLIARFSESYRRKFADLIEKLNRSTSVESDTASVRLCVEAMDMVLSNHAMLAKAIARIEAAPTERQQIMFPADV